MLNWALACKTSPVNLSGKRAGVLHCGEIHILLITAGFIHGRRGFKKKTGEREHTGSYRCIELSRTSGEVPKREMRGEHQ